MKKTAIAIVLALVLLAGAFATGQQIQDSSAQGNAETASITAHTNTAASVDYFIKIGDVEGESTDKEHKGWINLDSIGFEIDRPIITGRVHTSDFTATKTTDKSSPDLFKACAEGQRFEKATIQLVKATGQNKVVMEYELENVIITSVSMQGTADDRPTETIAMNFDKIKMTHTLYDGAGRITEQTTAEYETTE